MREKMAARGVEVKEVIYSSTKDSLTLLYNNERPITDVVDEALKESNNL
jgi:hypothetical protein